MQSLCKRMKIFTQNSSQNGKNFDTRSVAKFVPFLYTTNLQLNKKSILSLANNKFIFIIL